VSPNATLNSALAVDRQTKDRLTKDLIVYGIILAIAGLQVLMAYHTAPGKQLLVQMLALALVQGGIAVAFFMHLRDEKRGPHSRPNSHNHLRFGYDEYDLVRQFPSVPDAPIK